MKTLPSSQLSETAGPVARILLVEDEAIIALDLKRRLERLGYEVVGVADTGPGAIEMMRLTQPTLVFMDIVLQGPMDGVDTAAELVRHWDVPIVFLTAHSDAATLTRAKRVRPYGYLIKPFEEHELVMTLEVALHRHRTEAQARLLSLAMSNATVGIAISDARDVEQRFILCNAEFERMTGYSRAEILERNACFLEGAGTAPAAAAELRSALAEGRDCRRELLTYRKDGTSYWTELVVSTVRDGAGEVTHYLFFHTDISARKLTEDKLLYAQKMEALSLLTGGVAHDFNNILNVIISFASLAQEGLSDDTAREDIAEVLLAAKRGADLTRRLLIFSQQQPIVERPLDLNKCTERMLRMLERSVGEKVLVEFVPSPQPSVVRMDPTQFDQVLLNLAVNSRDSIGEAGRFRVTISHPVEAVGAMPAGRCVRLVVSDTGSGMDAATVARVFEPFFTTKPVGQGTGLGLATCFTIVDQAGGTIEIESAPGEGTTILIHLPVCDEPALEVAAEVPAARLANRRRILLVEDDESLRRVVVRVLKSAGYSVIAAGGGAEAIAHLEEGTGAFDLVFSDVVMPGLGGVAVVRRARELDPSVAVLLTSGYVGHPVPDTLDHHGPVLCKPYAPADLLRAVREALERGPVTSP